jgi:ABC-type multidrug transport system fused ATPase/permease subunit
VKNEFKTIIELNEKVIENKKKTRRIENSIVSIELFVSDLVGARKVYFLTVVANILFFAFLCMILLIFVLFAGIFFNEIVLNFGNIIFFGALIHFTLLIEANKYVKKSKKENKHKKKEISRLEKELKKIDSQLINLLKSIPIKDYYNKDKVFYESLSEEELNCLRVYKEYKKSGKLDSNVSDVMDFFSTEEKLNEETEEVALKNL